MAAFWGAAITRKDASPADGVHDTGAPISLAGGRYRLRLTMDRTRWATTEPADDLNRYQDSATITMDL